MDLILLEKIKHLGDLGDVVKVKPGYGRNYLMPKGKALPATAKNKEVFETRKAELVKKANDSVAAAKIRSAKLEGMTFVVRVLASEEGNCLLPKPARARQRSCLRAWRSGSWRQRPSHSPS